MYRNSLFDNPLAIFLLFLIVSIVNIISTVHFVSILLGGIVFMAFIRCVEKKYYYSLSLIVFSFIIIENTQGLKIFSLSLLSYFIYLFVIPKLKTFLTSINLYTFSIILSFYAGMVILYMFLGDINLEFISKVIMNYFLDIFIVSILI